MKAGFQTLPVQHGERFARFQTALYAPVLVAASLGPAHLGFAGLPYVITALVLGSGFVLVSWLGLRERGETRWAKGIFVYSLFYLAGLFGVLLATSSSSGA